MSRRKVVWVAAGLLVAAGAAVAVSAPGRRGHGHGPDGPDGLGLHEMRHGGHHGMGRGFMRGPLTKDEFDARGRAHFARLDRNSDGVIERSELEASVNARMDERRQRFERHGKSMGERWLKRLDADKDGKVSRAEVEASVRKRFAELDLDNDGRITDADLPPMLRGRNVLAPSSAAGPEGHGGRRSRGPLGLVRGADANNDGAVTLDEALASALQRFARADRNKDGNLDAADREAFRTEMIDYRVRRIIHSFGADKDGRITREQFAAKRAERFAAMDLDGNGTITRDELPQRGRWMRHGGHGRHGQPEGGEGRDGVGLGKGKREN